MAKRSYDQYCGLATALDLLGERWTLLIVRDLLLGPLRYTDLLDSLPGIGTNLLASRLQCLESLGVVQKRRLPPPAASTVYELTEEGRSLSPALSVFARWGARYMPRPESLDDLRPRLLVLAIVAVLEGRAPAGEHRSVELRFGADAYAITFEDGKVQARQGPAGRPDVVITTDVPSFVALAFAQATLEQVEQGGGLTIEGDRALAEELLGGLDLSFVGKAAQEQESAAAG